MPPPRRFDPYAVIIIAFVSDDIENKIPPDLLSFVHGSRFSSG
jgi:hypothetical protein